MGVRFQQKTAYGGVSISKMRYAGVEKNILEGICVIVIEIKSRGQFYGITGPHRCFYLDEFFSAFLSHVGAVKSLLRAASAI